MELTQPIRLTMTFGESITRRGRKSRKLLTRWINLLISRVPFGFLQGDLLIKATPLPDSAPPTWRRQARGAQATCWSTS